MDFKNSPVPIVAPLPKTDDAVISKNYPSDLELKFVQVIHRHGQRTPTAKRIQELFSPYWTNCQFGSFLYLQNLKESQLFGRHPDHDTAKVSTPPHLTPNVHRHHSIGYRKIYVDESGKEKQSNEHGVCYYGQLTDTGRSHMTNVGSKLRELYVDKLKFLTPTLDEAESLYLRSTDWSRTLESLHHVLLGLYPPETHRITEPPHIHIKTVNHEDTLYPHINTCSVLKKEFADFRKRVYQDTRQTVDWLKTELNGVAKDVEVDEKKPRWSISPSPHGIYDTVTAAIAHGYYVPPEITPNSLIMAEYLATREWIWSFGQTLTSKRLSIGRLIGELKSNIEGHVRTNANATKMAIFSGHDSTLGPLLLAMDVWDKRWPPFASMITFELFRQKSTAQPTAKSQRQTQPGNYFVRMIYNSEPMYIPGCQSAESHHPGDKSLCTLDAFLKVAEELIPTDYEAECSGSNTSE